MVKEMFLVTGEVNYHMVDKAEEAYTKRINAITARPISYKAFNGDDLSYMSSAIQENFAVWMEKEGKTKESYVLDDVVILSFKDLGVQETDQFLPSSREEAEDSKNESIVQ